MPTATRFNTRATPKRAWTATILCTALLCATVPSQSAPTATQETRAAQAKTPGGRIKLGKTEITRKRQQDGAGVPHKKIVPDRAACLGSNGNAPRLSRDDTPYQSLTLRITGPASAKATLLLGMPSSTPIDLSALGAPGCELLIAPAAAIPTSLDPEGMAKIELPFAGITIAAQAIVLDALANAAGITASNSIVATGRASRIR